MPFLPTPRIWIGTSCPTNAAAGAPGNRFTFRQVGNERSTASCALGGRPIRRTNLLGRWARFAFCRAAAIADVVDAREAGKSTLVYGADSNATSSKRARRPNLQRAWVIPLPPRIRFEPLATLRDTMVDEAFVEPVVYAFRKPWLRTQNSCKS